MLAGLATGAGRLFLSLGLGFFLGWILYRLAGSLLLRMGDRRLTGWQKAGAAACAVMHGGQDGQKFAAMLGLAWSMAENRPLAAGGGPHPGAAVLCAAIMGLGTLCGGRRIIQKTAVEMVKIDKSQGTAADLSSAAALLVLSLMGLPVSTTHTKTAALTGCAAARSTSSVRLSIVGQMLAAWLLTFPLCGLLSWLLTRFLLILMS